MNKKQIDWQNVENFYRNLSKNLDNAMYYIVGQMYRPGFEILKLIYLTIELEIRELDPDAAQKIKDLTNKIKKDLKEYEMYMLMLQDQTTINKKSQIRVAELKSKVSEQIDQYWEILHSNMNRLNMLFPKKPKDDLPIYQS